MTDVSLIILPHGTPAEHAAAFCTTLAAAVAASRHVAVMVDLAGPKVRIGPLHDGEAKLAAGTVFKLRSSETLGDSTGASTNHPNLPDDLQPGDFFGVAVAIEDVLSMTSLFEARLVGGNLAVF